MQTTLTTRPSKPLSIADSARRSLQFRVSFHLLLRFHVQQSSGMSLPHGERAGWAGLSTETPTHQSQHPRSLAPLLQHPSSHLTANRCKINSDHPLSPPSSYCPLGRAGVQLPPKTSIHPSIFNTCSFLHSGSSGSAGDSASGCSVTAWVTPRTSRPSLSHTSLFKFRIPNLPTSCLSPPFVLPPHPGWAPQSLSSRWTW